ncbi:MAG: site-specific integrase [Ruminococcus sp.]|nr:site-specific integrase [Ruminococcus sp.]
MSSNKGNPFKRGNTWTFIYYTYDESGKRKQHWKGGYSTKAEAEKALKEYKAKSALGQIEKADSSETLESYLDRWFNIHKQTLQPNTINGYNTNINNHIKPALGKIKLKNLKPAVIQNFYSMLMSDKNLSAKTVKYIHNVLKISLKAAVSDGLIKENVCEKVKPPKVPKYKAQLLTREQIQTLMKALNGHRYETEIKLAILLGLRRGEVLGLKFSDVDFARHTIAIQRQVSTVKDDTKNDNTSYYGLKKLKSESSNRVLSISSDIEQLIKRKQAFNELQAQKIGKEYNDLDLICCDDMGNVLSPQTLYHAYKRLLEKCDLPKRTRFHDLRHSYAVLCIDLNVPLKVLSQALGHSSTAVTDAVYADSIRAKQELAGMISDALNT